jgi:hypothetical protein
MVAIMVAFSKRVTTHSSIALVVAIRAIVAILGPGHFFGEGCLNGHPLPSLPCSETTVSLILPCVAARSARAEATPDGGGRPNHAGSYHSHPRSIRAIDQRVRTDFVLDVRDIDLRRRQPLQRLGYIVGPDAPCGTISEFHYIAPIVLFDLHRRSPV